MSGTFAFLQLVVVVSLVIYIHEMGHYLAAKRYGVKVKELSVGVGPRLFGWTDKHGTPINFRLFPIAGYVSLPEDYKLPAKQDALMIVAGPAANIICIALIIALAYLWIPAFGIYLLNVAIDFPMKFVNFFIRSFTPEFWQSVYTTGNMVAAHSDLQQANAIEDGSSWLPIAVTTALSFFMFSMIAGVLNLFPIPPLDGGRLLNIGISQLFSQKVADRVNGALIILGGAYLAMLTLGMLSSDLWVLLT